MSGRPLPEPTDSRLPYANWVTPWILENLQLLQRALKSALEDAVEMDTDSVDTWLHEVGGGFWAMGLPQARAVSEQARRALREATSHPPLLEPLVFVHDWLKDAALTAQMGRRPSAQSLEVLLNWLEDPTAGWPGTHFPKAQAAQELKSALDDHILRVRDLVDQWSEDNPPDSAAKEALDAAVQDLTRALLVVCPQASEQAEGVASLVHQACHTPNPRQAREHLFEACVTLTRLVGQTTSMVMSGERRDGRHGADHILHSAHQELAETLHDELKRLRACIRQAYNHDKPCEDLSAPLLQVAGALFLIGDESGALELRSLASSEAWLSNPQALAEALSQAEGQAYALMGYMPHMRRTDRPESPSEPTTGTSCEEVPRTTGEKREERGKPEEALAPAKQNTGPLESEQVAPGGQEQSQARPTPKVSEDLSRARDGEEPRAGHQVGVFQQEARQLMRAVGQQLPKWNQEPRQEASMAIRRAFHTLRGAAATAGRHDIERLAGAIESVLNNALSQIQGPAPEVRQGVIQAHVCLTDALEGDTGEWLERGLDALDVGKSKSLERSTVAARKEWASIPTHSKEIFHEFMANKWPVLAQPEHPDFWVAMRVLGTALKMVGADGYTLALAIAQDKKRLTVSARKCLDALYQEHLDFHRGLSTERLLVLLEQNIGLAKEAWARKDTQALDGLLQEQSQLLSEHGCAPPHP